MLFSGNKASRGALLSYGFVYDMLAGIITPTGGKVLLDGQPSSVTMPYIFENSASDSAMLFIADQLKAIGMDVTVSGMDQMSWFGVMMQGDWGKSSFHTYGPSYDPYTIMSNIRLRLARAQN